MDVAQALKDTENALRDLIAEILSRKLGDEWVEKCGVKPDRLEKWKGRKQEEASRQEAGVVEERLLYYADFFDLETILHKHWANFAPHIRGLETMEVWLSELGKLRDPDAHRRELLPHQKHLVLGIAGEIRTRMIRYRSKAETGDDYYPRIESARDSLGNIYVPEQPFRLKVVVTHMRLRPGDRIDYVVTASDPLGAEIEYRYYKKTIYPLSNWVKDDSVSVEVQKDDVGESYSVRAEIRSPREFHAQGDYDDWVSFTYEVLPPKVPRG